MVPPIIVCESGDIRIYATVEEAEWALETIDVRNGEYTVYDSEGRLLSVTIERYEPKSWWHFLLAGVERSILHETETEPFHAVELRRRLMEFLRRLAEEPQYGVRIDDTWLSNAALPELIAKVREPR